MKKLTILLLTFSFLATLAIAQQPNGMAQLPSMQWQKQELSDRITQKIERALGPVIGNENFYTDIEISTLDYEKPNFNKTDEEIALDKQVKSKQDDPAAEDIAEEEEKEDPSTSGKITFESVDPNDMPKDYIVFSKLGIEAPLIDDYNDFQPDGKLIISMPKKGQAGDSKRELKAASKKTADLQRKLDALKSKPKPSIIEQIWKYNESIDIFKNIDTLKIKVSVNEDIDSDVKKTVNTILTKLSFNVGDIKPKLDIKFIEFGVLKKVEPEGFYKSMSRYSTAFGLVLGALFLCAAAWVLFQKFEELKKNESPTSVAGAGGAPQSNDEKDEEDDSSAGAIALGSGEDQGYNGIERFVTFYETHPDTAVLLIRKWISLEARKSNAALKAIVQQLENKQLVSIFSKIDEDDRTSWKDLLNSPLTSEEILTANKYISNQIVEEIIVPGQISDPEVADILMKIEPEKAAEFIKGNPVLGQILLNVLNTNFISQVFEFFNDEELSSIVSGSLKLKDIKITDDQLAEMKKSLEKYKQTKDKLPFVKKILELIPIATPRKEKILFHSLGELGDSKMLRASAEKYFPAELIFKLPANFLKTAMQSYPLTQKVELLSAIHEDDKNELLEAIAPAGSKAADMLDLEFEKNEKDISFRKKIDEEGESIHKEYVDYMRKIIVSEKSISSDISELIDIFINEKLGQPASDENVTQLRAS